MDLTEVGFVELLGGVNLRREQDVEQTLPPGVCLLEGDDGLLVVLTWLDGLDELVAIGGGDVSLLVLTVVELPGVLEGLPVNRGAVVVLGLLVDGVGDDGLAVLLLVLDVRDVVIVDVELAGSVEKTDLRVVELPDVAGVAGTVGLEGVLLLGDLGDGQAQLAALLELGAVLGVVGSVQLDVQLLAGCGVAGVLGAIGAAGAAVGGAAGENEGRGGDHCEGGPAELHVHFCVLSRGNMETGSI